MEKEKEISEKSPVKAPEDSVPKEGVYDESKSEEYQLSPFVKIEPTSRSKIIESNGDDNMKSSQSSSKKKVAIQLEPLLSEKLAKKKAVADELEDKLQALRSGFKGTLQSVDRIKQELKDQESNLLKSIKNIEGYMRQIYSLKREADDMFERLKFASMQLDLDFSILIKEYNYIYSVMGVSIMIFKHYKPALFCCREIIKSLSQYNSIKELVEYYLVLKLLRKDLLEEDQMSLEEAENYSDEQRSVGERARNLPLEILEKEEILFKIKSEEKEMRLKNIELEKQISNLMSAKAKEEMTWHDIKRWIGKTSKTTSEIIPLDLSESKDSILDQLQILHDFIVIGNKMVERLHIV